MRLPLLLAALPSHWHRRAGAQAGHRGARGARSTRFEADIHAFEMGTWRIAPEGRHHLTGSSSIRMWTSRRRLRGLPVLNRGFGSMIPEVTPLDRMIVPHKPRLVVLYCGGNASTPDAAPRR
jgi:hypothetical protein